MSIRLPPVPIPRDRSPVDGIFAAIALIEEARACMRTRPETASALLAEAWRRLDGAARRPVRIH